MTTYKYCFVLLVFFLISVLSKGQTNFKNNNKIASYYNFVSKAEDFIIEEKYDDAVILYQKAFEFNEPFNNDLKNAMQAAYLGSRDSTVIVNFIIKYLKKQSVSLEFILSKKKSNNEMPYAIVNLSYWDKIRPIFDTVESTVNQNFAKELDSILQIDQNIRNDCYKQYGDNFYTHPEGREKIMKVDSNNIFSLIKLYQKYGSFSESVIGINGKECIYVITLHNGAWGRTYLIELLLSEVLAGRFNAKQYANLIDEITQHKAIAESKNNNLKNSNEFTCYYCENEGLGFGNMYIIKKFTSQQEKIINDRRKEIFLDDYIHSRNKTGWTFQNKGEKYFSFQQLYIMGGFTDEVAFKEMKRLKNKGIEYLMFEKK